MTMRNQEITKQNQKNEKINDTSLEKQLTWKIDPGEFINYGTAWKPWSKKSLDIIFHEIIKENCPDILAPEGKINIERMHQSPPERNPKRETPKNIVTKFQSSQVKEKMLQAARKKQFEYCGNTIRIT